MNTRLIILLAFTVSNAANNSSQSYPFLAWFNSSPDTSQAQEIEHKWVRDYYQYRARNINRLDVDLQYTLGKLTLNANNKEGLISGYIRYFPDQMKPEVSYDTFGSKGIFRIDISTKEDIDKDAHSIWNKINWKDNLESHFNNELNFSLPPALPTELRLNLGLGDADLNLSRLYLTDINLNCGLSDVILRLEEANGVECDRLSIDAGLGKLTAIGLQYLQVRDIYIKIGLGSATLDFSGNLDRDMFLNIDVGLGSLELTLPENANIRATISNNFLSHIDTDELINRNGEWVSPTWSNDRPTIRLTIDVGLGSVDLDFED